MSELAAFLRACVEADRDDAPYRHQIRCHMFGDPGSSECTCDHPAEVLADVDSKLRIIDLHDVDGAHECAGGVDAQGAIVACELYCPTLRLMTVPYVEREGYDKRWRP